MTYSCTGGVREALFGDENYKLMWGKRTGFAKVALQANVVSKECYVSQIILHSSIFHFIEL